MKTFGTVTKPPKRRPRGRPRKPLQELLESGTLIMNRHAQRIVDEAPDHEPWPALRTRAQAYLDAKGKP